MGPEPVEPEPELTEGLLGAELAQHQRRSASLPAADGPGATSSPQKGSAVTPQKGRQRGRAMTPRLLPTALDGLAWTDVSDSSDDEASRVAVGEGVPSGSQRIQATKVDTVARRERATTRMPTQVSVPLQTTRRNSLPANFQMRAPPMLDAVPARRLRRMLSTPEGRKDAAISQRVPPGVTLLQDGAANRSSFPPEDESRADWLELRHLQTGLDERSKKFHARQYAADTSHAGTADPDSTSRQVTPSSERRHKSAGSPIRTPGRSSQRVPAPGRNQHERAASLGSDFWIELKGAVYGVSRIETQIYVDEQQQAILADTVHDVIEFQSSDTGGHQARTMLGRLDAARELFETERSFADFIARNPTTRLNDFQEIEEVLVLWFNVDAQLDIFRDRCLSHIKWCTNADRWRTPVAPDGTPWYKIDPATQSVVQGFRPNSLMFAQSWSHRLNTLLCEYQAHSSRRRTVGLPSLAAKYGNAMMLHIRLVYSLTNKDSEYMSEKHIGDLIQLAKGLLSNNCASDAGKWRAHLRELERSEYDEMLAQLFERYFDIIRSPGWSFRPEVRVTSWIQADIETQVARRNEALNSEWRFLIDLLPKLQLIVPDAEKHFVVGMMTLSQALLRDLRILCSTDDAGASQVFDDAARKNLGDVTQLLLGDLNFARQVCESAYIVSQYEVLHVTDLLNRLSAAGFRAVHVYDPALERPGSNRSLAKRLSQPSPTSPTSDEQDTSHQGAVVQVSDDGHPDGRILRHSSEDVLTASQEDTSIASGGAGNTLSSGAQIDVSDGAEPHDRRRNRHVSMSLSQDETVSPTKRRQAHRVILVPPRLTEIQLKGLFHAWCSHDAAVGYMIVLSTSLPGADTFEWQKFQDMHITVSKRSARLIYDLRLLPQCLCLTVGSNQQLQRSRQDFEREVNHVGQRESAVSESVRVVIEKDVAFDKSKQLQCSLHAIALQVADQLFDRAETVSESAVEEMCEWEAVEGDWMMAFSYCKSVSRLSLTRAEMSKLTNRGRSAAEKYDELYQKLKEEKRRHHKQQQALQKVGGMARVGIGLRRWRNKSSKAIARRTGSLPKSKSRVSQRRRSLNSQVDLINVSLAGMNVLDDDEDGGESPGSGAMTPPVDYQAKAKVAQRFAFSRAEKAWRLTHHVPRPGPAADRLGQCDAPAGEAAELLERVRNAVAEGKDEAEMNRIVDEFAAQHIREQVGNSVDPMVIHDARLLISRSIGQLGEQPQPLSPHGERSPAAPKGHVEDRGEKSIFTEKCVLLYHIFAI